MPHDRSAHRAKVAALRAAYAERCKREEKAREEAWRKEQARQCEEGRRIALRALERLREANRERERREQEDAGRRFARAAAARGLTVDEFRQLQAAQRDLLAFLRQRAHVLTQVEEVTRALDAHRRWLDEQEWRRTHPRTGGMGTAMLALALTLAAGRR